MMILSKIMTLKLLRDKFTDKSTGGILTLNNMFECYTLEDVDRKVESGGDKIDGQTAVPRGEYQIVLDFSPRFQTIMPHLLEVPGFAGVRIHAGNKAEDTEGCILVGRARSTDFVSGSGIAYKALYAKLLAAQNRGDLISIKIT